jgi:hypothetical protein
MAVGDPADLSSIRRLNVLRRATVTGGHCGGLVSADNPQKVDFEGQSIDLLDLIDRETRPYTYATRSGPETVEIPFTHLVILQGQASDGSRPLASRLKSMIRDRWPGFIDPRLGVSIEIFQAGNADKTYIYFGKSVHAPPRYAQPIGRVEVELLGEPPLRAEPTMPDGRPAAFYPGQTAVAFARHPDMAPATCELLPKSMLCVMHAIDGGGVSLSVTLDGRPLPREPRLIPTADGAAAGAFVIDLHGEAAYNIHYDLATNTGRLHRDARNGAFAIVGILGPDTADPRRGFWYVDLDQSGCLVSSAFVEKARSIRVARRDLTSFSWRDYAQERDRAAGHRIETCAIDRGAAGGFDILRKAQPGGAFGYLAGLDGGLPIVTEARDESPAYVVEWLTTCMDDQRGTSIGEWTSVAPLNGLSLIEIDGALVFSRPVPVRLSPQEPFRHCVSAPRMPDTEFIVGPLCLRPVGSA